MVVRYMIRHQNGLIEDVPLDVAHRLVSSGLASQMSPLPVVESAMLAGPEPRQYAPPKKPRKPRKPKR